MLFSPHVRSIAIREVSRKGTWAGSAGTKKEKIDFVLYRGLRSIHFVVKRGRRWFPGEANTVWDTLDLIEREKNAAK